MLRSHDERACDIAFDHIDEAQAAIEAGRYTTGHVAKVRKAHATLGRILSDNWQANHAAPRELEESEREIILRYVWIASSQLDAVEAFKRPERREETIKVDDKAHRWVVTRTVTIDGVDYLNERACYNPAAGSAQLDEWEAYLRANLPRLNVAA